jgi:hypothetical protein
MKNILSNNVSGRVARSVAPILVLLCALAASAFSQARGVNAVPVGAISSANAAAPKGVKILAQVPLEGQVVTRMYTQWERGRTYLYIEHGSESLTAVDVTKKRSPHIVRHEPAKVEAAKYQPAEGGMIEVTVPPVIAGFDNGRGPGTPGSLRSDNPDDAQLLRAFGSESSNLADRDRNLVFFASSTRLLILEDGRWKGIDYNVN